MDWQFSYSFLFKLSCRLELLKERERRKEEEVTALKCAMQTGMVRIFLLVFSSIINLFSGLAWNFRLLIGTLTVSCFLQFYT
jgi:hypothetical protein